MDVRKGDARYAMASPAVCGTSLFLFLPSNGENYQYYHYFYHKREKELCSDVIIFFF